MPERLLLIEDNPNEAEIVQRWLHRRWPRLCIQWAKTLSSALCMLATFPAPQIILLDLTLPDAVETMAIPQLYHIAGPMGLGVPIIALTGMPLEYIPVPLRAQFSRYVQKSAESKPLIDIVQELCGERARHA